MKDIICFLTLFYIMLSMSSLQGCGQGQDEAQKPATEPAATQTVVEPKADQPDYKLHFIKIARTVTPR